MVAAATSSTPDPGQDAHLPTQADAPEPNPIAALFRAMRGRWRFAAVTALVLGPALAVGGFLSGVELYESQAILRVFPQESNILYATGDDSVLKTFDSFVKAETTYVASHPVMARAAEWLGQARPDIASDLKIADLSRSIDIRRSDSLIVLKTKSREATFARDKLDAVVNSYLALKADAEEARSAVRLSELHAREGELVSRLAALRADQLEVGGEFGMNAIAKAHVEKIAQIDALAARKSEVAATLATLEASTGATSADMSNQDIMRATLLDRALADLSFDRAKRLSELARLRALFAEHMPMVQLKLEEIMVIEQAIADRREQIRLLGQTGALTDVSEESAETSITEIRALYEKLEVQLDGARREALDLNRRRIDLDRVEKEIEEAQELLEETRRALEVIRLESGRALPGYAVLMSPPSEPVEPADDSRKMFAAGGFAGGAGLALCLALGLGLAERRVRFAESLVPVSHRLPVVQVSEAPPSDAHSADRLRNELQLQPLRGPRLVGKAPVIAVTRADAGPTSDLAHALAKSYARTRMRTLFVDADLGAAPDAMGTPGWRELLSGGDAQIRSSDCDDWLSELPAGTTAGIEDRTVSAPNIRKAIEEISRSYDVVIVSAGSLHDRLACQFVLSAADVGVVEVHPSDRKARILAHIDRLDSLPRHGSVAVMRHAHSRDPWLAVRT